MKEKENHYRGEGLLLPGQGYRPVGSRLTYKRDRTWYQNGATEIQLESRKRMEGHRSHGKVRRKPKSLRISKKFQKLDFVEAEYTDPKEENEKT